MVDAFRDRGTPGRLLPLADRLAPPATSRSTLYHPLRGDAELRRPDRGRDRPQYADYLHGQVRELLTGYGQIDVLWFDFSYPPARRPTAKGPDDWDPRSCCAMVRELQPGILVNDRLGLRRVTSRRPSSTSRRRRVAAVDGSRCRGRRARRSTAAGATTATTRLEVADLLIRMLVDTVAKGGNLLLNVGPTGRGEFDPRALAARRHRRLDAAARAVDA